MNGRVAEWLARLETAFAELRAGLERRFSLIENSQREDVRDFRKRLDDVEHRQIPNLRCDNGHDARIREIERRLADEGEDDDDDDGEDFDAGMIQRRIDTLTDRVSAAEASHGALAAVVASALPPSEGAASEILSRLSRCEKRLEPLETATAEILAAPIGLDGETDGLK